MLAVAITAPVTACTSDTLTVTFLDVGQAASAIVRAPNGHAMLVDAGRQGNAVTVSDAHSAEGITRLDHVVGTHEGYRSDRRQGPAPVVHGARRVREQRRRG